MFVAPGVTPTVVSAADAFAKSTKHAATSVADAPPSVACTRMVPKLARDVKVVPDVALECMKAPSATLFASCVVTLPVGVSVFAVYVVVLLTPSAATPE
jgi:hypothetical protein